MEKYCQTCSSVYQGGQWIWECDGPELQFPVRRTPGSPQGGVLEQLQDDQPPLLGRNVLLQGGGVFGQQPSAIVPPSPVLTPEPPVPMFGSAQDATGQIAPQGQVSPSLGEETQEQATEEQTTDEDEQVIASDIM